jgi:hypothetical protein
VGVNPWNTQSRRGTLTQGSHQMIARRQIIDIAGQIVGGLPAAF